MPKRNSAYEVKPFPLARRMIVDSGRSRRRRHLIQALVEVDVTEARRLLQAHKAQTGEALSFTAFIISCLGKAVDQNRYLHAQRDFWGRLILFEEVDCATAIEIEFQGQKFPLTHVIRAVNKRSFRSIHDEIRAIQANPQRSGSLQNQRLLSAFLLLPPFARDLIYRFIVRSPRLSKQWAGTVFVSAVGMYGNGGGWDIGVGSLHTISVLLGGIGQKPGVVDGQIAVREYLSVTIEFDHDIVDGAPAARFVQRFKAFIERGEGLTLERERQIR
jgi:pyruvate/2-oxoglutarate dehydrogenase complex dihydrolipoamide acyltransferase (E2) component